MPIVNLGVTEKTYGYLHRKVDEQNAKRKKGDPEFRISDIASQIFSRAMELEMKEKCQ